jgi:hypothetical protein
VLLLASQNAPSTGLVTEMPKAVAKNSRAAERTEKARIVSAGKDSKKRESKERRGEKRGSFAFNLKVTDKRS